MRKDVCNWMILAILGVQMFLLVSYCVLASFKESRDAVGFSSETQCSSHMYCELCNIPSTV